MNYGDIYNINFWFTLSKKIGKPNHKIKLNRTNVDFTMKNKALLFLILPVDILINYSLEVLYIAEMKRIFIYN